jgi:ABC-type transport system involved in cytochrome c biogenesis permease subunit
MTNLTMGFILMFFTLYIKKAVAIVHIISSITLYLSTAFLLSAFLLRWYISQTIPLTNGYETMVFVALATLLIALFLHRRISVIAPFGLIISGFTLLVSHLAQMNPQITPLMPVLQSPLLSSHVALIMLSYSLFAFMTLNGAASLVLMRKPSRYEQSQRLTIISRIMLYPATLLLAIGIFIGAVWANVSWGSYWSWDPKEVWALVTMIVYAIAFHDTSIPWLRSDRAFNTYILLASLTVLMTYFGVNYLLGGMHSYANT